MPAFLKTRVGVLLLLASGSFVHPAQAAGAVPPPTAVVTNVKGPVTVQRKGKTTTETVRTATPLYVGDTVQTGKEGTATIYFPNRQPQTLQPHSRLTVPAEQSQSDRPSVWVSLWRALVACCKRCLGSPATDRPAAVRGAGEDEGVPTALSPRETRLLEPPARFIWNPVEGATKYEIVIGFYDTDEKVWRATTAESEIAYPPDAPRFQAGRKYYWQVTAWPDEELDSTWFLVLTPEEATPIQEARAAVGAVPGASPDPASDLALVSLDLAEGLLDDALTRLRAALEKRPEDALRWRLLSEAYTQALLPQRAQAAAQKAGQVTKIERESWEPVPMEVSEE